MGSVEDDQPVSKRLKLSPTELRGLSNGLSVSEPVAVSSSNLMARPLPSEGDRDVVGSKGLIKKVEFVRVITNALYSLGYKKSGAFLEEESGISLHSSVVNLFMKQILDGNWDNSLATLTKIGQVDETVVKSASFLILEQKFYELLNGNRIMDALKTLRNEIVPLGINGSRVRELSNCIALPTQCESFGSPRRNVVSIKSRSRLLEELQKLLPPSIMIPERRLEHLVEQALCLQQDACMFHNSLDVEMSLFTDHHCERDQIPSQTLQVLQEHGDEVWYLKFSHNGRYLASSSNDGSVVVWEIHANGEVSLKHRLSGHQKPVSSLSWSPDDRQLLTCAVEETVRQWDVSSGECLHVYEKLGLAFVSCGWDADGKSVITGLSDKSISRWDLDGKEVECWKGQQSLWTSDLEITSDGKHIISICKENELVLIDREKQVDRFIEETNIITSFSLSRDNNYLLVNLSNQEIHLWKIQGDLTLIAKYKGHKRIRFVIRSCFGGLEEAFVASGSEDSQIYVWHRGSGELVETLTGHSGSVNCVSWNPKNPQMLASASDDGTIRIWGVNHLNVKRMGLHCNGIHHCNGGT